MYINTERTREVEAARVKAEETVELFPDLSKMAAFGNSSTFCDPFFRLYLQQCVLSDNVQYTAGHIYNVGKPY